MPFQNFAGILIENGGAALEAEVMPGLFVEGSAELVENSTLSTQKPLIVFRLSRIESGRQCDQIGQFLKSFGDNFVYKSGPKIWRHLGLFRKMYPFVKTAVDTFWTTLGMG